MKRLQSICASTMALTLVIMLLSLSAFARPPSDDNVTTVQQAQDIDVSWVEMVTFTDGTGLEFTFIGDAAGNVSIVSTCVGAATPEDEQISTLLQATNVYENGIDGTDSGPPTTDMMVSSYVQADGNIGDNNVLSAVHDQGSSISTAGPFYGAVNATSEIQLKTTDPHNRGSGVASELNFDQVNQVGEETHTAALGATAITQALKEAPQTHGGYALGATDHGKTAVSAAFT